MRLPFLRFSTGTEAKSSPPKRQRQGTDRFHIQFNLQKDNAEERRNKLVQEMAGGWKLRKIKKFLDFVPAWKKKAPILDLSDVPHGEGMEDRMYDEVDDSLASSGCIPKYEFVNTSRNPDAIAGTKPDGVLIPQGFFETKLRDPNATDTMTKTKSAKKKPAPNSNLNYMRYTDIVFEMKPCANQDPFLDPADAAATDEDPNETMEADTNAGIETRGQLIEYVTDIMSLQHRLFTFAVTITGDRARISRWDRSGSVISTAFDYTDTENNYLGEFLWRYSHASRAEQGFDDTVIEASSKEAQLFTRNVNKFLDKLFVGESSHKETLKKNTLDLRWPTQKITVVDDNSNTSSDYLVRRPFSEVLSPCGRSTRGYLAYSMALEKIVFLKDTWRTDTEGVPSESEAYEILRKAGVLHLPTVIASGDVRNHDGTLQETLTDKVCGYHETDNENTTSSDECHPLRTWFRRHIHHRVVEEFALPLHFARSSKELVVTIRDVLETILQAHRDGHLLHRDISAGNVMLSESFKSILNDWDHAVCVPLKHVPRVYRTGTWAFMSIEILSRHPKLHSIVDDVESCYWVLLFVASRYFDGGLGHDSILFDEWNEAKDVEQRPIITGGDLKANHLVMGHFLELMWKSAPLTRVVHGFAALLYDYHRARTDTPALRMGTEKSRAEAEKKLKEARERLENVADVIKVFDDAIESADWPQIDAPVDVPEAKTDKQKFKDRLVANRSTRSMPTGSGAHLPVALVGSVIPATAGPIESTYRTRATGSLQGSANQNFSTGDKRTLPDDDQVEDAVSGPSELPSRSKRAKKGKAVVREPIAHSRTTSQELSTISQGPASGTRSRTTSAEESRPVIPFPRPQDMAQNDQQAPRPTAPLPPRRSTRSQTQKAGHRQDSAQPTVPLPRRVTRSASRNKNASQENLRGADSGPKTRARTKSAHGRL